MKKFVFRFPTIYSYSPYPYYFPNGVKTERPVYQMIEKAMKGEPIEVYGDGTYSKDMVHVYDCAQELCKAVLANVDGGVYNVGTGIPVTIKEQIETIIEVFLRKIIRRKLSCARIKFVVAASLMDIENAKRDLGYQPKYSCKDLFEDYKKRWRSSGLQSYG